VIAVSEDAAATDPSAARELSEPQPKSRSEAATKETTTSFSNRFLIMRAG